MPFRWFPWRFVVSRLARRRGFIDPVAVLSRLHRFAQPSEVMEPIELLRAGVVFHARGLINTRAVQHNLDWVWPFWIERQFDPRDVAFVPRAFSITHVNLTHRNWTAVGRPDWEALPIVDPRGLVTPFLDGWSLDLWIVPEAGQPLLPSRARAVDQRLRLGDALAVATHVPRADVDLHSIVDLSDHEDQLRCRLHAAASASVPGWLAFAVRPTNPEGVSFIHEIEYDAVHRRLRIDGDALVCFDRPPDRVCMSHYRKGDVLQDLPDGPEADRVRCDIGLATAAALFRLESGAAIEVEASVPLVEERASASHPSSREPLSVWAGALDGACTLDIPDEWMQFLYDAAVRSLVLHSPGDVYPGPYTYKRFWFRDAAFILHALLMLGLSGRVQRALARFPARQTPLGYFLSQEGEWDSNGEAIWIIDRYRRYTGERLSADLVDAVASGARWIRRKRLSESQSAAHAGLMPAGFSAEHLGPNDYYFWDNYWSLAGLHAAAAILREHGAEERALGAEHEAARLSTAIERSVARSVPGRGRRGIPASPYRRMDSGAIGSIVAGYPLRLAAPRDPGLLDTVEFLLENCMVDGGFFQDMIHSGINAYLTLHLAQVLLRAGDPRYLELIRSVARLASPTGQWPEAIHPRVGGGCMGDGQHIWAAAEWVLMMRSLFVREEGERLILGSGLPAEWLAAEAPMRLGATPTPYGPISVEVAPAAAGIDVRWDAAWRAAAPVIEVRLAGLAPVVVEDDRRSVRIPRASRDVAQEPR